MLWPVSGHRSCIQDQAAPLFLSSILKLSNNITKVTNKKKNAADMKAQRRERANPPIPLPTTYSMYI
jgi:hypothetical protein